MAGNFRCAQSTTCSSAWLCNNFHEPAGQVTRWVEILSEFDFKILHHPGNKHVNADALSLTPRVQEVQEVETLITHQHQ